MGILNGFASAYAAAEAAEQMRDAMQRYRETPVVGAVPQARQLLDVGPDATAAEIRTAFTAKVKESHPDAGGKGGDIQQLKQARNLLLEDQRTQRLPKEKTAAMQSCPMCRGHGRVAVGFGNQRCTTCNGTGEVTC